MTINKEGYHLQRNLSIFSINVTHVTNEKGPDPVCLSHDQQECHIHIVIPLELNESSFEEKRCGN